MEELGKATEKVSHLLTSEVGVGLISRATMPLHPLHLYLKFFLLCLSPLHSLSSVSKMGCCQPRAVPLCAWPSFHGTVRMSGMFPATRLICSNTSDAWLFYLFIYLFSSVL